MGDKRKISSRETYVLDEKDLEELDEATLTSVLRDISISIEGIDPDAEDESEPEEHREADEREPDDESSESSEIHDRLEDSLGYVIPDD